MRITLLTSSYPRFPGDGTAPFVQSIAEHLAKRGHQIEVVAPYDEALQAGEDAIVPVHRFRYAPRAGWHIMGHARSLHADVRLRTATYLLLPFFLLAEFLTLWRVARAQNAQLIYAHWVLPNGPAAALVARILKIPLVISLHGSDMYIAKKNKAFAKVAAWAFRRAAVVTACSPELRVTALELGAPQDTRLLAWGADPARFHPEAAHPEIAPHLGYPPQNVVIAGLGRMVSKKGFETLLRAFADLVKEYPHARLVIGGDGPLRVRLTARIAEFELQAGVSLPGTLPWDQAPAFLAQADIFVLPSVKDPGGNLDGLPTVLLEAMACGLAVIASDIGGVTLAIQDGINGLLVQPGDVRGLKNALEQLLNNANRRQLLSEAARRSVVNHLNWANVAAQLSHLFHEALR